MGNIVIDTKDNQPFAILVTEGNQAEILSGVLDMEDNWYEHENDSQYFTSARIPSISLDIQVDKNTPETVYEYTIKDYSDSIKITIVDSATNESLTDEVKLKDLSDILSKDEDAKVIEDNRTEVSYELEILGKKLIFSRISLISPIKSKYIYRFIF